MTIISYLTITILIIIITPNRAKNNSTKQSTLSAII